MTTGVKIKPAWLEPLWERKKDETVDRVRAAVAKLTESRKPVTVASICATVRSLYGASISSNTIKRNHLAYEIYKHHCGTRHLPLCQRQFSNGSRIGFPKANGGASGQRSHGYGANQRIA